MGIRTEKKLIPKYLGLNPVVSVNELFLFKPHRGDQANTGEYIREKTQSSKGFPVKANKHNMNQWLRVKARKILIRIEYPLVNTERD